MKRFRRAEWLPRPLDPVRSIKLKLGLVMVASGAIGLIYFRLIIGWLPIVTSAVAISLSLLTTLVLAHGTTRPLREMTAAARAMARGDYSRRIRATSRDEVGELAQAFNLMSGDLAAADQHRREIIANVSHELRTPITALQGVLENIVDGVAEPDPALLRTALAQTERLGRLVTELLDLSSIDAGVHPLRTTLFPVQPFIDEVLAEARVPARTVRFESTVEPAGAELHGDRERLKQVMLNLLDNAARHSPSGRYGPGAGPGRFGRDGARGARRRTGHRPRGTRTRLRTLHPGRTGHRWRDRPRPGHRPLGGQPPRRYDRGGFHIGQ